MARFLNAVEELARENFKVFPVYGKVPAFKGWQAKATSEPEAARTLFRDYMDADVGIATGAGLFVIDCDTLEAARDLSAQLPETRTVCTRRGLHYLFVVSNGVYIPNRVGWRPKIDVRGEGGFVVAPPTRDRRYLRRCKPAPAPAWLVTALTGPKPKPIVVRSANTNNIIPEYSALPKPIPLGLIDACRRIKRAPDGEQAKVLFAVSKWAGSELVATGLYPKDAAIAFLFRSGMGMRSYDKSNPWTLKQVLHHVSRGVEAGG